MADRIAPPSYIRPIIREDGTATQELTSWFEVVTERLLIIGEGNPEGVVEAPQGAEYMDKSGFSSNIKYIKRDADDGAGDTTKGWILI